MVSALFARMMPGAPACARSRLSRRGFTRHPFHGAGWYLVALGLLARTVLADMEYQVVDLGTLGGEQSEALGINDRSQVVGWSLDAEGRTQAFVWQNGRMTGLGFLPGGTTSVAYAINNNGEIAGRSQVSPTNAHAFYDAGAGLVDLGTLGGPQSIARAINDRGDIAGFSGQTNDTHNHTFVRRDGRLIHIKPFHNFSSCEAYGLNEEGRACGITALWANNDRWWGYVWFDDNGNGLHDPGEMKVLGSLGVIYSAGSASGAAAINDIGQVAGWSSVGNTWYPTHAMLVTSSNGQWKIPAGSPDPSNLLMQDLGVLGGPTNNSSARAINNHSWVVGSADMPAGTNQAFLWRAGAMTNLNLLIPPDSGWVLTTATGINDRNEIVGSGLHDGQPRAYLLRREGRITNVVSVIETNRWVFTNELGEVATQEIPYVAAQVLQWAGGWDSPTDTPHVFTVEYCDVLRSHEWQPVAPTAHWPVAGPAWTNGDFDAASTRFFRVRAREAPTPRP